MQHIISGRIIVIIILSAIALLSGWFLNQLITSRPTEFSRQYSEPDYYMEDFTTITTGDNGLPLNTLYASYMEHIPADDSLQLQNPKLEIFRANNDPLYISAESGQATNNNETVTLHGKVKIWQQNNTGQVTLSVETSEVTVLVLEEYAETDQNVTIIGKHTIIKGQGIRAHFKEGRIEILSHEQTIITQPSQI